MRTITRTQLAKLSPLEHEIALMMNEGLDDEGIVERLHGIGYPDTTRLMVRRRRNIIVFKFALPEPRCANCALRGHTAAECDLTIYRFALARKEVV